MLLPLLVALIVSHCAEAQSNFDSPNNGYTVRLNPVIAGLLIAFICGFFFLGFFSIYLRRCGRASSAFRNSSAAATTAVGSIVTRPRGLDRAVLELFPTMAYSEVKGVKDGKGSLECAICLSEFVDDDVLRLLPGCSHVFHVDCIDVWLESKVTCPVCRANLSVPSNGGDEQSGGAGVAVTDEEQGMENLDLELGQMRPDLRRWYSTGHVGEAVDRYTLRLPENVRREIMGRQFRRAASVTEIPVGAEDGVGRRWFRRLGSVGGPRSGRWSFLFRTVSGRRGTAAATERAPSKRIFPTFGSGVGSELGRSEPDKDAEKGSTSASVVHSGRV